MQDHDLLGIMKASIDEYAERQSKRRQRRKRHAIVPARIPARLRKIKHAGAILWDVYGTLLALPVGDLERTLDQKETMFKAFKQTAREFGFDRFTNGNPAENLMELYVREIEKTHRRKRGHGVFSPEVKIEQIWLRIIRRLETSGYKPDGGAKTDLDLAFRVAYFFDDVYQAKALYPGTRKVLEGIKNLGLRQGIISNAQFYTPIALKMLLGQSGCRAADPMKHLFDSRLVFFSYRLGVSKPNPLGFEKARSRLQSMGIEPARVVYVGNDILNDMIPACKVGFRGVLFAGDRESLRLRKDHPDCRGFKPEAVIKSLPQLLDVIA